MSHPKNKSDRKDIGKNKSKDRCLYDKKNKHLFRDTTKLCSCHMCGNPRRYFNDVTKQEKRNDESNKLD